MTIDWAALLHLGGHGIYVWPAYAAAAVLAAFEAAAILSALRGRDADDEA